MVKNYGFTKVSRGNTTGSKVSIKVSDRDDFIIRKLYTVLGWSYKEIVEQMILIYLRDNGDFDLKKSYVANGSKSFTISKDIYNELKPLIGDTPIQTVLSNVIDYILDKVYTGKFKKGELPNIEVENVTFMPTGNKRIKINTHYFHKVLALSALYEADSMYTIDLIMRNLVTSGNTIPLKFKAIVGKGTSVRIHKNSFVMLDKYQEVPRSRVIHYAIDLYIDTCLSVEDSPKFQEIMYNINDSLYLDYI